MPLNAQEAGQQLADFLRRSQMQQKELAAFLGIEASYISRMVRGHVNWTTGQYFGQIAAKLQLADHEIKQLNPAAVVEFTEPAADVTDESRNPPIPQALLEAAELYQEIDPRIGDPKIQLALARAGWFNGGGPQTAKDWIRYFNDVRDWIGRSSS